MRCMENYLFLSFQIDSWLRRFSKLRLFGLKLLVFPLTFYLRKFFKKLGSFVSDGFLWRKGQLKSF
ncbi:hypothetical protein H5410_056732, partial [Solanum commersonii]